MMGKGDHSSKTHPSLERSPGKNDNWVESSDGLPDFINRIAKHIFYDNSGKYTISHAIAAAVERVKVLAAGGNPKAIAALAQWNANRAKTKAKNFSVEISNAINLAQTRSSSGIRSAAAGSGNVTGRATGQFDERKHNRSPLDGKFGEKFSSSQLQAARRVVEGAIVNLRVGETVALPNKLGLVTRTEAGFIVRGPAGFFVSVRNVTEAIAAAASIIAGKMKVVKNT